MSGAACSAAVQSRRAERCLTVSWKCAASVEIELEMDSHLERVSSSACSASETFAASCLEGGRGRGEVKETRHG